MLPWGYANHNESDFQQTVVTDIAWCSDCTSSTHPLEGAVSTDGQGWFGAWDLSLGRIWGTPSFGDRPQAVVDCHLDVLRAPSRVVEYWSDGTDSVVWAGLWDQASGHDKGGVLRSENDGGEFCYEMTFDQSDELSDRAPRPDWINGSEDLLCREGASTPAWEPCDNSSTLTPGTLWSPNEDVDPGSPPLGSTTGIAIARNDLAFAVTYDRQDDDNSLGALVVLEGTTYSGGSGGIEELAAAGRILEDSTDTVGKPSIDCDDLTWADLFDHQGLFVRISPDDQAPDEPSCETNGGCDLVVGFHNVDDTDTGDAGATCSLFHVNVTESGGTWSSTWESLILDEDIDDPDCDPDCTCDIEYDKLTDAVIPPWDPGRVYVVGNSHAAQDEGGMCAFDLSDDSFVEQVVDANRHHATIDSVTAHPHVENVLFIGSYRTHPASSFSEPPGVYMVSLGEAHVNGTDKWVTGEISVSGLTHPSFLDLELGVLSGSVEYLFAATGGSGPVEGLFCQEAQEDCE